MIDQTHTAASDALTVARLAGLTRGDYDRLRHDEAAKLAWRVETLDAEVQKARAAARVVDDAEGSAAICRSLGAMADPRASRVALR
jgi:hypothetical protein